MICFFFGLGIVVRRLGIVVFGFVVWGELIKLCKWVGCV